MHTFEIAPIVKTRFEERMECAVRSYCAKRVCGYTNVKLENNERFIVNAAFVVVSVGY